MNSLETFIRHELENQPGTAAAPQGRDTLQFHCPVQPMAKKTPRPFS